MTNFDQFPLYGSAIKNEGQFHHSFSEYKVMGPYHPQNRAALVCVTRGGTLRLLYQQPDARWAEAKESLDSLGSSDDVLSHASFGADRGT